MKLHFTAIALFVSVFSFAQANLSVKTNEIAQVNDFENLLRELSFTRFSETKVENIEGTAYLEEKFIIGIVTLTNGSKYADIPLRYNVYNEEIEFRGQNGKEFNINNPESIRELTIGDSKFIYTDCKLHKENKMLFAEVLSEGKVSLLKHHRVKLVAAKPAESHKAAQPPRLVKASPEYLIRKEDGSTQYFRNEKELVNLLADKSEEIQKLMKVQKLSVHKEEDIIAIVDFYNGID